MTIETSQFQNGADNFVIEFDVAPPPAALTGEPGAVNAYAPKPMYRVARIKIQEVGAHVGENGRKQGLNFDRGFETLEQARLAATEYAQQIVRDRMPPRKAPLPVVTKPVV